LLDDLRGDRFSLLAVDVVDHDAGPGSGCMPRVSLAQATTGTGDRHRLAVENSWTFTQP
jgi:hypothetical protein